MKPQELYDWSKCNMTVRELIEKILSSGCSMDDKVEIGLSYDSGYGWEVADQIEVVKENGTLYIKELDGVGEYK